MIGWLWIFLKNLLHVFHESQVYVAQNEALIKWNSRAGTKIVYVKKHVHDVYGANVNNRLAWCHCIHAVHWVNTPAPASHAYSESGEFRESFQYTFTYCEAKCYHLYAKRDLIVFVKSVNIICFYRCLGTCVDSENIVKWFTQKRDVIFIIVLIICLYYV